MFQEAIQESLDLWQTLTNDEKKLIKDLTTKIEEGKFEDTNKDWGIEVWEVKGLDLDLMKKVNQINEKSKLLNKGQINEKSKLLNKGQIKKVIMKEIKNVQDTNIYDATISSMSTDIELEFDSRSLKKAISYWKKVSKYIKDKTTTEKYQEKTETKTEKTIEEQEKTETKVFKKDIEKLADDIKISPNPVRPSWKLTIDIAKICKETDNGIYEKQIESIAMYEILGKYVGSYIPEQIIDNTVASTSKKWIIMPNSSKISKGMYLLQIKIDGKIIPKKVMVM